PIRRSCQLLPGGFPLDWPRLGHRFPFDDPVRGMVDQGRVDISPIRSAGRVDPARSEGSRTGRVGSLAMRNVGPLLGFLAALALPLAGCNLAGSAPSTPSPAPGASASGTPYVYYVRDDLQFIDT